MVDHAVVVVVLVGARLVYMLAALWMWPRGERARAQALAMVVRATGPGGVVQVARADGGMVTVRSAAAVEPAGPDLR